MIHSTIQKWTTLDAQNCEDKEITINDLPKIIKKYEKK